VVLEREGHLSEARFDVRGDAIQVAVAHVRDHVDEALHALVPDDAGGRPHAHLRHVPEAHVTAARRVDDEIG
jgi:hypothetical protein